MGKSLGDQAVVIGAGMGGLSAACALSEFFTKVIVMERDDLPAQAGARAGVPQGKHPHVLLAGGLAALKELLPGIEGDLASAGAVPVRVGSETRIERPGFDPFPQRDLGWCIESMTRPVLEHAVRQRTLKQHNIELRSNCTAQEIVGDARGSGVKAVRYGRDGGKDGSQTLPADLVVDASGRGALTLAFLEARGLTPPSESAIGVDIRYSTALFSIPDDAPSDWKSMQLLPDPRVSGRGAFLFPVEGRRWMVALAGVHGDAPPGDHLGFLSFAQQLRTHTIYNAIREAEPLGEVVRFAFPQSERRHFDRLSEFPRGLLPLGDAICKFNPVFGQGMSVAAQQACRLKALLGTLSEQRDPLSVLAPSFFAELGSLLETPWAIACLDFAYPQTRGERPSEFEQTLKFLAALNRLAAREPEVHKVMSEVSHLMKPRSVYREPAFAQRVLAEM
jgi:2-polyprenyl-6-methoxyphenol hydroxylase-like FAD-dependent oxidoreductase